MRDTPANVLSAIVSVYAQIYDEMEITLVVQQILNLLFEHYGKPNYEPIYPHTEYILDEADEEKDRSKRVQERVF